MVYLAYWNPLCLYVGINADFSSLNLVFTYFGISNKLFFYTWNMAMDPWSLFRSKWTWQHWVHPNWPLNWVLLLRKCNDSHSKLKILQQLPKKNREIVKRKKNNLFSADKHNDKKWWFAVIFISETSTYKKILKGIIFWSPKI